MAIQNTFLYGILEWQQMFAIVKWITFIYYNLLQIQHAYKQFKC